MVVAFGLAERITMLRITSSRQDGTTRIRLEGKLVGPWVAECRALCAAETARGQELALDVSEVRFADQEGARLLRELAVAGQVERSSGFATELMREDSENSEDSENKEETMERSRNGRRTVVEGTSDGSLVARLRSGQAAACEELVRRHGAALLATARRYLADGEEALEALKEACVAAFPRAHECPNDAGLAGWLHRLVVDACVARLRSIQDPSAIDELLPGFDPSGSHAHPIAPWSARVRTTNELHAQVRQRIDELPPPYRIVVLLADQEGLAPHAIAERLGLSRAEVEACLHRARQALITLLGPTLTPREAG
jgi:RNA polymerase sigma-70 factor (ECF subfamily)